MSRYSLDNNFDYRERVKETRLKVIDRLRDVSDSAFSGGFDSLTCLEAHQVVQDIYHLLGEYARRNGSRKAQVLTNPEINAKEAADITSGDTIWILGGWWAVTDVKVGKPETQLREATITLQSSRYVNEKKVELFGDEPVIYEET